MQRSASLRRRLLRCRPLRLFGAAMLMLVPGGGAGAQDDYPALVPLDTLLAQTEAGRLSDDGAAAIVARAERLRARAAVLRTRDAIDAQTRARMTVALAAGP